MPVLLMMLFILLVFSTGDYWAVVAALAIYNGALIGEALRAGLAALPRGQREAALSLGMRQLQSKMLVEFPQAFRQMLPIIVAQLVVLLKDTSLGFIVGLPRAAARHDEQSLELLRQPIPLPAVGRHVPLYLAMNLSLSWFARWLSRRTASRYRPGPKGGPVVDPEQGLLVTEARAEAQEARGPGG